MLKRLLKVLLIILILFFCSSKSGEATTTASIKLTANKDRVMNGEEVEISYNIIGQKTASYFVHIYFDDTRFDFISGPENLVIDKNHIKIVWYDIGRRKRSKTR